MQNSQRRIDDPAAAKCAEVLDLNAFRAANRTGPCEGAALTAAAAALSRLEVGAGDWTQLAAALVAPFNP